MRKIIRRTLCIMFVVSVLSCMFSFTASAMVVKDGFTLKLDSSDSYYIVTGYEGTEKDPVIPASVAGMEVKSIADSAFRNNNVIESISLTKYITYVGNYAFMNCTSLKSIGIPSNVTFFGEQVFRDCTSLENVYIYSEFSYLPDYTFYNCTSLQYVKLSALTQVIGIRAFDKCSSLVSLPNAFTIREIKEYAFANTGLTNISLYSSLEKIGYRAFYNCSNLKDIEVPRYVTEIEDGAFENCADDLIVRGYNDYVQGYCTDNNITYISAIPFYGDVDGDGYVTVKDATYLQKTVVKLSGYAIEKNTEQFTKADVDGDNRLSVRDAAQISKFVTKLIKKFPVEQTA